MRGLLILGSNVGRAEFAIDAEAQIQTRPVAAPESS